VLVVVEDDQEPPVGERGEEVRLSGGRSGSRGQQARFVQAEGRSEGLGEKSGVGQGCKFDEGELTVHRGGGLDREPGLARAAGAGEGHEPFAREQPGQPGEFFIAADEAGQLRGHAP